MYTRTLVSLIAHLAHLAIVAILLAPAHAAAQSRPLVIDRVHVVDVASSQVSGPTQVRIAGGFLRAVGDDVARDDDRIIDAGGGYLIPGLAEMHAHVPPMDSGQRVDDVLMLYLTHGITTIRGMLGEPGHLELRRELAEGSRTGPRLITSGPSFNGRSVSDPEQAAAMAADQAEAGYDFLKLHPGLWPEAFDAIVDTANEHDMPFAGHVSVAVGLERALAAGQATIDHLDGYAQVLVPEDHERYGTDPGFFGVNLAAALDAGRIDAWAQRTEQAGVWNVPTQTLIENLATGDLDALVARPAMRYVPANAAEQWLERARSIRAGHDAGDLQRFVDIRRQLIRALHESGAGILLGADAPQILNVPGDAIHHELAIYVASGLSPAEALATGTVNVAKFLGQPAHGCLAAGCMADAVLLDADPLEEIAHTREIRGVLRAGEWFGRERLDAELAAIAERAAGAD